MSKQVCQAAAALVPEVRKHLPSSVLMKLQQSRGSRPGRPELFSVLFAHVITKLEQNLGAADSCLAPLAKSGALDCSKPADATQSRAFRDFCVDLLGSHATFKGRQMAEDIGYQWPALYVHALAVRSGPGPPSAICEAVPACKAACASLPGGAPAPGTMAPDLAVRDVPSKYLGTLANAALRFAGEELDRGYAAVLQAAKFPISTLAELGVCSFESPRGLAKLLLGPGGVQTWMCEERKFECPAAAPYKSLGQADSWTLRAISEGVLIPAVQAVARGNLQYDGQEAQ